MNFSRVLVLGGALVFAAACGGNGRGGPDGGSNRQICTEGISSFPVTVIDGAGAPVKGATVTAKLLGASTTVNSTTNDQGVATAISADVGSGTYQLTATQGTRTSSLAQVEWLCGECTCTATPAQVTLTLP